MKTFILASKNQHKANEIKAILGADFDIITQTDAGVGNIDIVEDGNTFEENAIKKAETIMKATAMPVIADDSGLCVDFLNGAPGIYTARYAGENASDQDNINKLLTALDGVPIDNRDARFVCVIAFAQPNMDTITFRGNCFGTISLEPMGSNGFGYDPIFYIDEFGCSMAEIPPGIKNSISHRSLALNKFANYLKTN